MLKLFQSIFGAGEAPGRYPESLIEVAVERAVDCTDPRLRTLPRYRRLLREPVLHAADHVVALVDALPHVQAAGRASYGDDERLTTLFASADRMLQVFAGDSALHDFLASQASKSGTAAVLLLVERIEKHVMGMEMDGEVLRREVAQVAVDFRAHRLVDPTWDEDELRRQLKRRAFDHLLSLALQRIAELRGERADLTRQRTLLRRKLDALNKGQWGFDAGVAEKMDPQALQAELDETERQLAALGTDDRTLFAHMDIVIDILSHAGRQMWAEPVQLHLDRMNVQRGADEATVRQVDLQELHNARGRRLVMLPLAITLDDLPHRDDLLAAAQRVLG